MDTLSALISAANSTNTIALAAVLISAITLIAVLLLGRRAASMTYVEELERKIKNLESDLEAANRRIDDCGSENVRLLRLLFKATTEKETT